MAGKDGIFRLAICFPFSNRAGLRLQSKHPNITQIQHEKLEDGVPRAMVMSYHQYGYGSKPFIPCWLATLAPVALRLATQLRPASQSLAQVLEALLSDGRSYTIKLDVYGLPLKKTKILGWKIISQTIFCRFCGFHEKK